MLVRIYNSIFRRARFATKKELYAWVVSQNLTTQNAELYKPEIDDLYQIYKLVRKSRCIAITEYGSGWSTLVLARALEENRLEAEKIFRNYVRHPNPYSLMTIDVSPQFQKIAIERCFPISKNITILPIVSDVKMGIFEGQLCHYYSDVPPFSAEFIYLDGPDSDQVSGDINGFHIRFGDEREIYGLPMGADILRQEPFYWPGTIIVIDGRGANAQFLRSNFKRKWKYKFDIQHDQHIFILSEKPWGKYSEAFLQRR